MDLHLIPPNEEEVDVSCSTPTLLPTSSDGESNSCIDAELRLSEQNSSPSSSCLRARRSLLAGKASSGIALPDVRPCVRPDARLMSEFGLDKAPSRRALFQFRRACLHSPLTNLTTDCDSADCDSADAPSRPCSPGTAARIQGALIAHRLLAQLSPEQRKFMRDKMRPHRVRAGTVLISQGEEDQHFYVVERGQLDAYVQSEPHKPSRLAASFAAGDSFGELALVLKRRCVASVIARTDAVLWAIDGASFKEVVRLQPHPTCPTGPGSDEDLGQPADSLTFVCTLCQLATGRHRPAIFP